MTSNNELEPKEYPQRTVQQNKALHVLFKLLSDNLNEHGLDMRKTLKPGVEIPWSPGAVKEHLWRPVMKAQLNKDSTTELNTVEIDAVFNTINKHMGEKFNLHTPFPSVEELIREYEAQRVKKEKKKSGKKSEK